eukprot:6668962-Prymnesium_polylepis.4
MAGGTAPASVAVAVGLDGAWKADTSASAASGSATGRFAVLSSVGFDAADASIAALFTAHGAAAAAPSAAAFRPVIFSSVPPAVPATPVAVPAPPSTVDCRHASPLHPSPAPSAIVDSTDCLRLQPPSSKSVASLLSQSCVLIDSIDVERCTPQLMHDGILCICDNGNLSVLMALRKHDSNSSFMTSQAAGLCPFEWLIDGKSAAGGIRDACREWSADGRGWRVSGSAPLRSTDLPARAAALQEGNNDQTVGRKITRLFGESGARAVVQYRIKQRSRPQIGFGGRKTL